MPGLLKTPMLQPRQPAALPAPRTGQPAAAPNRFAATQPRAAALPARNVAQTPVRAAAPASNPTAFNPALDTSHWTDWGGANTMTWDERLPQLGRMLGTGMYPGAMDDIRFGNSLNPAKQAMIKRMLLAMSPGNSRARLEMKSNANVANNLANARRLKTSLGQQGFGDSVQAGADVSAVNQANTQSANDANEEQSSTGMLRSLMGQLGVIEGAQMSPQVKQLMQMIGLYQEHQDEPNPLFGAAGNILGAWAGGGFK